VKIYTKTGDDGTTGLIGGSRVTKSDASIEAYGTIDELNAVAGWVAVTAQADLREALYRVQSELFAIGSHLATPEGEKRATTLPALSESWITRLEAEIDAVETALPTLRNFILPGGTELAARLHLARTVCRRAERTLVLLAGAREVNPVILSYINRLSDWLFVQARLANQVAGVPDVAWVSR
jgi:cob(I)alamin adenosyltransferase